MKRGRFALRACVWHAPLAVVISGVMVVAAAGSAFGAPPVSSHPAPKPHRTTSAQALKPLPTHFAKAPAAPPSYQPSHTTWPKASSTTIALGTSRSRIRATTGPIWAQAVPSGPTSVHVKVLDHAAATAAGIDGVLMSVSGDRSGTVRVGLDYGDFAQAYGGDYGSRLQIVSYPSCVLTTPTVAACRQSTPLASSNDAKTETVSASTAVAGSTPLVLAATPTTGNGEEGGSGGTYAATSLSAAGTWSNGDNAGGFTYSYPITTAPAASSLTPKLSLDYDSGATDGETAATQAQASWLGEGWSTQDAFIEQSFQSCSESPEGSPAPTKTYDRCYDGPVFTMSLNGATTPLVWDSTKQAFKAQDADGSIIQHICTKTDDPTCTSGSGNGTSTYDQDWWKITDRDGTTYSFGRNQLPGYASGKAVTNSVASEPVYSSQSTDPCYKSAGFSSSVCTMAYRWGLDYVVDAHSNAMAYYYAQTTNYYGEYNGASNVSYVRDIHVDHVDYGFTDGNAYGTAPDRIAFTASPRCVTSGCGTLSASTKADWPDVPYDLVCAYGATCTSHAPSYFSTVRLTSISAEQYSTANATYKPVDTYAFTQSEPDNQDGTAATLWLSAIVHTGYQLNPDGTTTGISLPPVQFAPIKLANRTDLTIGQPAFNKNRIWKIITETGSEIDVSYELPSPCSTPVKITQASNSSSCYPVSWTPEGYSAPITDWFNKWAVEKVVQTDPLGGLAKATSYSYSGAAWHFDDNELVKAKYRTYGQFRGYGDVITYLGDGASDQQSKSEATYYQGMSRDNNSTVANVKDSLGGLHEDVDQLAGSVLEDITYLGSSSVDHSTITSYWVSAAAATRTRTKAGLPALTSNWVAPIETYTRQALTSTGTMTWRNTETDTTYVSDPTNTDFGLATYAYSHTVPINSAYDSCTATTYAAAGSNNLVGLVSATETDSVACGGYQAGSPASVPGNVNALTTPAAVARPDQVASATRNFYDDSKFATTYPQAAAPTHGDVTMVQKAGDYVGGAFTWQTQSQAKFDSIGRQTDAYDGNGNDTTTTYTDTAGLTTAKTVTNALSQKSSSTVDPRRALTLTATDSNSVTTTETYDALGRLSAVWLANRAVGTPANYTYAYQVSNTAPTATTTSKLNDSGGWQTSTAIYDGLLRQRETQERTPEGGRLLNDTFYDSRGWVSSKWNGWSDPTLPTTTLAPSTGITTIGQADVYTYDSLGRVVIDENEQYGKDFAVTTTAYNGDRTTVIAPTGGTTKTTITDPLGRTSEIDSYRTVPTVTVPSNVFTTPVRVSGGTSQPVTYGYDRHGNQNSTVQGTGASAPTWTQSYNLLGQVTQQSDPDAGSTTGMKYDKAGNLTESTDARLKTTSYKYDALNRKIGEYDSGSTGQTAGPSGNQIAAWVYDNSNNVTGVTHAVGKLTTETSYSNHYAYTTQQTNFNVLGESLGTSYTIPTTEGALGTTYLVRHSYTTIIGLPYFDYYNAQNGLPMETVTHGYTDVLEMPLTLTGSTSYLNHAEFDEHSRVKVEDLGTGTAYTEVTDSYYPNSGLLQDQNVSRQPGAVAVDHQHDDYDPAGNLTTQTSTRNGASSPSETQCYRYDGLDQLTSAWTANDACNTTPSSGNFSMVADSLGSGSAYWTTWAIDTLGDRTSQVQHGVSGASDTSTTYTYGTSAGAQPHTLTSTTTTGAGSGTTSYAYDTAGEMTTRNAKQGNQTLTYDDSGHLTAIGGSKTGASSFVYDADGNILVERDPTTTTLYLGDQQFVLDHSTGAVTGTRYYSLPGGVQAVRTGTATTTAGFVIPDQHGSPSLYVDYTGQTPAWRQYTPYGSARGTSVTAPDNRGFLDKPTDSDTGLTVVGARSYDPDTGRFITDDPVLEKTDPTELNGYGYASNNPVVHSDPTGQRTDQTDPADTTWVGIPAEGKKISHKMGTDHPSRSSTGSSSGGSGCSYVQGPICGRYGDPLYGPAHIRCPMCDAQTTVRPQSFCSGSGSWLCATGRWAKHHWQISLSFCDVICISMTRSEGQFQLGMGTNFSPSLDTSATAGFTTATPDEQGPMSLTACGSYDLVAGCFTQGLRGSVDDNLHRFRAGKPYYGASVGVGEGAGGDVSYAFLSKDKNGWTLFPKP